MQAPSTPTADGFDCRASKLPVCGDSVLAGFLMPISSVVKIMWSVLPWMSSLWSNSTALLIQSIDSETAGWRANSHDRKDQRRKMVENAAWNEWWARLTWLLTWQPLFACRGWGERFLKIGSYRGLWLKLLVAFRGSSLSRSVLLSRIIVFAVGISWPHLRKSGFTVGNLELPSTLKPVLFWNQMGLAYLVKKSWPCPCKHVLI